MVLCSRHVVNWWYSLLYLYYFTTNRSSSGYAWRFFFSHVCYVFSHFGCPEIGTRQNGWSLKIWVPICWQSLDQKKLWGGSLWLIYHDTPGWWLPLSNGLSFSILWHMNSWLGMSTISTQQISEMKPTISFKIQDMLFFSDGPSMFLAEPTSLFQHQVLWFAKVGKPFGFGWVWVWVD